jgi:hypothetical protein
MQFSALWKNQSAERHGDWPFRSAPVSTINQAA